ncbi:hypothetical protein [Thorsellia kenyensis]|uniref:Holin n=1 Tax=Thorsellia kenyensis TaxID=1549888 RepID=A0ABV6C7P5_9GAMM
MMNEHIQLLFETYNWMTISNLVVSLLNFILMFAYHKPPEKKPNFFKSLLATAMMFWMGFISYRILTLGYDGNIDLGELGFNTTFLLFVIIERGNAYLATKRAVSPFLGN